MDLKNKDRDNLIIGSHVSYKNSTGLLGSVKEALSYGANTFMFYTGAPQNTLRGDIDEKITNEAKELMKENNIDISKVIVHAPYIVNLANMNNFDFSVSFLEQEVERCNTLGIKYLVLHPGSAVNNTREEAINNISDGLNLILDNDFDVIILLETMAGKGNEIGRTFEEIDSIIDKVKYKDKIGVCLDTCHLNDAGYDIGNFDELLDDFDKKIGINKIGCIHVNDSKNIKDSHKDRHENIGFGTLGFDNLINIIYNYKLRDVPKILETPYVTRDDTSKEREYAPYKYEIEMIRNRVFDSDLINKIRNEK
ncbi:MAG: deoxyribonuclease IV [Bacilli bacterium]